MRIIAGSFRGTALAAVGKGDAAAHLRPTSDRVRESLFNVLAHAGAIDEAVVLDLFAGTGALGLEALSRGGSRVTFVDDGRAAQALLRQNIAKLRAEAHCRVLRVDARRLPVRDGDAARLVFLDPPYGRGLGAAALASAVGQGWLADGAKVVWEESAPMDAPPGFALTDRRHYGDTHVTFLDKV